MSAWVNVGDVNPVENGGLWVKKDENVTRAFHVIEWLPFVYRGKLKGWISSGFVDLNAQWIDYSLISDYVGNQRFRNMVDEVLVSVVFKFYNVSNFDGCTMCITERQLMQRLDELGIRLEPIAFHKSNLSFN